MTPNIAPTSTASTMPSHHNSNSSSTQLAPNILKHAMTIQQEVSADRATLQPNLQCFLENRKKEHPQSEEPHGLEHVLAFLASPESDIFAPANETDLTKPMSQYFISSSHNTYLTGNQLYSDSSVDGYMKVLKAGCRCVEIDVWDGRAPGEESISDEVHGLRERLQQLRGSGKEAGSGSDKPSTEHKGLREKLRLKKSAPEHDSNPNSPPSEVQIGSSSVQMPLPWRAASDQPVEPRVLHGHTLTRDVPFRKVCEAIKATAFASSSLPVIVSLEVHCNLEQQALMVEIMQSTWRDHLLDFTRYATGYEPEYTAAPLPSPEQLRNRILIKVKYTPPEKAAESSAHDEKVESESSDESEIVEPSPDKPAKKKKILDELSLLGVYTRSFHFKNFVQEEAKIPTHVFALSESKLSEAMEKHALALTEHNRRFFMRAYPKGVRVSSSNLNPIPIWRHGVQMVALNWQRCDKAMMVNEGMFGGTQGWVLKPGSFRDGAEPLHEEATSKSQEPGTVSHTMTETALANPTTQTSSLNPTITHTGPATDPQTNLTLTVQFYATQNLPIPTGTDPKHFRPYIKCILHTEALLSQRRHSGSASRSPSPHPKHASNNGKESARERATSLLHDYAHRRGRRASRSAPNSRSQSHELPTKAKPKCKAQTQTQRGASPDFNGETLRFESVPVDAEMEYLTFVRFKLVHDVSMGKDPLAGWACIRLGRLRRGWGFVRWKDRHGEETEGRVLVRVEWEASSADA